MKKRLIFTLCAFIGLFLTVNVCCSGLGEAAGATEKATRTILLYACGSDLEENYGMATWNLCQILESELTDDVNVLVMTGGAKTWKTQSEYLEGAQSVSANQENQLWLCSGRNAENAVNGHGRMTLLTDIPLDIEKTLMSDSQTLLGFINYAAQEYPAEMYDLILWDHGGGPALGFGMDNRVEAYNIMSVGAIAKCLKESAVDRFDIVNFDACLMSSVEVAATLSECADYLILSAETEPGYGQEYVTWLDALAKDPGMNGYALGRIIVDAMIAFYENEESAGYRQDGTLAVIDTKNFRERMVAPITELARTMDRELTQIGEYNALLNFEDELRSQAASYEYAYDTLLDLGNFAEHLGMCISEVNNTSPDGDFEALRNRYTDTAEAIRRILCDNDGSEDDMIYSAATATMTRPVKTKIAFARDAQGRPQRTETMAPSGLSVFFTPVDLQVMDYTVAVDEMCEAVEDAQIRDMLRALEVASLRYLMAERCGLSVAALREAGEQNVYYKTVRDSWKVATDRDYGEIYRYQEQFGIKADITGLSASDWDIYISTVIDLLNKYADVDTETWLALLTAQQFSQVFDGEKATAVGVDRTGDGVEDAYRVTIPAPLNLVRDVYTRLSFGLGGDEDDEDWAFYKMFLGLPDYVNIAKVHGNPVQDEIVNDLSWGADLGSGVRSLFAGTDCAYELPTTVDRWYEILDSDGIGHVISVDEVDLGKAQDLRIPVIVHFAEPKPDGSDWREDGYLIYGNGHFKGFQPAERFNPLIALNNSAFYGATIQTAALLPANVFGYSIEFFMEISAPFALPAPSDGDRGMKLVMTPIGEIKDLADTQLTPVTVLVDLYGQGHDISAAMQAAREASAAGNVTYSIEAAQITVPDAVFNRRLQLPEVTVKLGDKALVQDEDYELVAVEMLKAGTQELKLFGRGDYVGYTTATFTILPAESTVEALEAVALSDLANGDVTVLTVDTPAHPDNVQFDFSGTDERLRQYLKEGADGKTVLLEKGAEAGAYEVRVFVIDGGEDTYANIDGEIHALEVKSKA